MKSTRKFGYCGVSEWVKLRDPLGLIIFGY